MSEITFEWDGHKNSKNIRKHDVSFEEAKMVFYDESAVEFYDHLHSNREERYLMLGRSLFGRLLMVCYCVRKKGSVIRIISARKAVLNERKFMRG